MGLLADEQPPPQEVRRGWPALAPRPLEAAGAERDGDAEPPLIAWRGQHGAGDIGSILGGSTPGSGTRVHGLTVMTPSSTADVNIARITAYTVAACPGLASADFAATKDFMRYG